MYLCIYIYIHIHIYIYIYIYCGRWASGRSASHLAGVPFGTVGAGPQLSYYYYY